MKVRPGQLFMISIILLIILSTARIKHRKNKGKVYPESCKKDDECEIGKCLDFRCAQACSDEGDCSNGKVCGPKGWCLQKINESCKFYYECDTGYCQEVFKSCSKCTQENQCSSYYSCNIETGKCEVNLKKKYPQYQYP